MMTEKNKLNYVKKNKISHEHLIIHSNMKTEKLRNFYIHSKKRWSYGHTQQNVPTFIKIKCSNWQSFVDLITREFRRNIVHTHSQVGICFDRKKKKTKKKGKRPRWAFITREQSERSFYLKFHLKTFKQLWNLYKM